MVRISSLVLLACALLLVSASSAVAKKPCDDRNTVPPGQSEVDQYTETVPGDCGNEHVPVPGAGDDPGASIPPATLVALEELGPDGRAAALLAAAGRPGGGNANADADADGSNGDAPSAGDALGGANPAVVIDSPEGEGGFFNAVVDALSGEGGLGWILPLALIVIAAQAIIVVVRNRRSA
jgi:hypothetical protein